MPAGPAPPHVRVVESSTIAQTPEHPRLLLALPDSKKPALQITVVHALINRESQAVQVPSEIKAQQLVSSLSVTDPS